LYVYIHTNKQISKHVLHLQFNAYNTSFDLVNRDNVCKEELYDHLYYFIII